MPVILRWILTDQQEAYAYDLSADLGLISVGRNKNSGVSNEYTAQKDQQIEGYESYQQIKADVDMEILRSRQSRGGRDYE